MFFCLIFLVLRYLYLITFEKRCSHLIQESFLKIMILYKLKKIYKEKN